MFRTPKPSSYPRHFIDLFCGVGGFSAGLLEHGFKPILAVDEDLDLIHVYNRNVFPVAIQAAPKDLNPRKICDFIKYPPGTLPLVVGDADYSALDMRHLYHFFRVTRSITPMAFALLTSPEFLSKDDARVFAWRFRQRQIFSDYRWSYQTIHYDRHGLPLKEARVLVVGVNVKSGVQGFKPDDLLSTEGAFPLLPSPPIENFLWRLPTPDPFGFSCKLVTGHVSKWEKFVARRAPNGYITPIQARTHLHPTQDRWFTTREVARLRGFEDYYILYDWLPSSKVNRATPVPIAERIGAWLLKVDRIYWYRRTVARKQPLPAPTKDLYYELPKGWLAQRRRTRTLRYLEAIRVRPDHAFGPTDRRGGSTEEGALHDAPDPGTDS